MRRRRQLKPLWLVLLGTSLALGGGCAHTQAASPDSAPPGIEVHYFDTAYDGYEVSGLLVVTALRDVEVDRRFVPNTNNGIHAVVSCKDGSKVKHPSEDYFPQPPKGGDLISLRPGESFGKRVEYLVVDKDRGNGPGPECARLTVYATTTNPSERSALVDVDVKRTAP